MNHYKYKSSNSSPFSKVLKYERIVYVHAWNLHIVEDLIGRVYGSKVWEGGGVGSPPPSTWGFPASARGCTWIGDSIPAGHKFSHVTKSVTHFCDEGHSSNRTEVSKDLRGISCDASFLASGIGLGSTPTTRQDETQVNNVKTSWFILAG